MPPIRILLIEDELNIREVYTELLREAGFEVLEASDGDIGLQWALSENWDLMLLDIMLPKKDGLEILTHVKKEDRLKEKPVILLTNLGRESIIQEGYSLGAIGYLIKSEITPDEVVKSVRKALEPDEELKFKNTV